MSLRDRIDKNGKTDLKVSVIILAHKKLPLTIDCLESVLATRPKGMDLEVILMSNGSRDATESWLVYQEGLEREEGIRVKAVYSHDNLGFAGGCNEALKYATGDLVIFLNNDTVVTPGWIAELITPLILRDDIAVTAPVSNFAGGMQMIDAPYKGREEMLAFALDNYRRNHNKAELAGMVTGLCIALRRDTIEKLKGFHAPAHQLFDEIYKIGMWEDNDLCLRIQLLGMKCLICYGAFIHHEGSATFKQLGDPSEHFNANQKRFKDKWGAIFPKWNEQKIVAMLRVKDGGLHIRRFLDSALKWIGEIVILDTGSTDDTLDIIKDCQELFPERIILDEETYRDAELNEYRERQYLLELAKDRDPDWIVRLDVDEIFEDRIIDYLPILLSPGNPQILCWRFPMRTFWRGMEKYRIDGDWGKMAPYALFRNLPGQKIQNNDHPQGFHCPTVPVFQSQNIGFCGVNILHYGYCDPTEATRKYNWYQETDTDKRAGDIGGAGDYRHLVDETNLELVTYFPDNTISLNMLVNDGEWEMAAKTVERLETVVDEFVLVATGKEYPGDEILYRLFRGREGIPLRKVKVVGYEWNDDFAAARNFGLENCTGRWVLHLDPDEELRDRDIALLVGLAAAEYTIGYSFRIINYFDDPGKSRQPEANIQQAVRLFRRLPGLVYSNPVHETLDDAIKVLEIIREDIERTDLTVIHRGYLLSPEKFAEKMEYYAGLNEKWKSESPEDPRPWYNLGVHYLDMGEMDKALEYLETARDLNNRGETGLFQVGLTLSGMYLRTGLDLVMETIAQLPADHPQIKRMKELASYLEPRVGKVRHLLQRQAVPPPAITPLLGFINEDMIVVEIGVQRGHSSEAIMRKGVKRLYCIDPWDQIPDYKECADWPAEAFGEWKMEALDRLSPWIGEKGTVGKVGIFQGTSEKAAKVIIEVPDFVFIDGNHEEDQVYADIKRWWPKVAPGGYLAGHDYYPSTDEFHRVKEAVDRWAEEEGVEIEVYGDCWLVRKK